MVRTAILMLSISLISTGCVRSMQDVIDRGITDTAVVESDSETIQKCILAAMDDGYIRPSVSTENGIVSIAFGGDNGYISHYTLTPVKDGTRVDVRRRPMIMDHYKEARLCFS